MNKSKPKLKTGGTPPVFHFNDEDNYNSNLMQWFNHLNSTKEIKDSKSYLIKFIKTYKSEYLDKLSNIRDTRIISTYGWLAKMHIEGCVLKPSDIDRIFTYINLNSSEPEEKPSQSPIKASIDDLYNFIDKLLDDFIISRYKLMPYSIQFKLKSYQKQDLLDVIDYIIDIKNTTTSDYSFSDCNVMTNNDIKRYMSFIDFYINDIKSYISDKQPKKRTKKPIDKIKLVSNLKYMSTHETIPCIDAVKIIHAKYAVLYDAKTKILTILDSNDGYMIKGQAIENVTNSISKHVRDDELWIVHDIVNMNKSQIKVNFDKLKSDNIVSKLKFTSNTAILKII